MSNTPLLPRELLQGELLGVCLRQLRLDAALAGLESAQANQKTMQFLAENQLSAEVERALLNEQVQFHQALRETSAVLARALHDLEPDTAQNNPLDKLPSEKTLEQQYAQLKRWRENYDVAVKTQWSVTPSPSSTP